MADPIIPPSTQPVAGQSLSEQQIRIMRGDLGAPPTRPVPPPIIPPGQRIPVQTAAAAPAPSAVPPLNIPSMSAQAPSKPLFDADEPVFTPNTMTPPVQGRATPMPTMQPQPVKPMMGAQPTFNAMPAMNAASPSVDTLIAAHQGKKKTGMLIGLIGGLIVLAVIGYFVYPLLTKSPDVAQTPPPVAPLPPIPPPTPTFPSLFTVEPVKRSTVVIGSTALTATGINAALKTEASPAGSAEVLMTATEGGDSISFTEIMGALVPTLKDQTAAIFTGKVSAYVYSDETGNWPGYIAQVKTDATPESIKNWFTALEQSASKKNFFIASPGALQAFKNGLINNTYPDRYAVGATKGASFGYLILPEEHLVLISTSFPGMRDGLRLLGH